MDQPLSHSTRGENNTNESALVLAILLASINLNVNVKRKLAILA